MIVFLVCIALPAFLCMGSDAQGGDELEFSIIGEDDDPVSFIVPKDGIVRLRLLDKAFKKNESEKKELDLMLSRFRGQRDHWVSVTFKDDQGNNNEIEPKATHCGQHIKKYFDYESSFTR